MKIMFASDIHGSVFYCKKMIERFEEEKCEKMVLLGDLLYHGPRNDLPKGYNPKEVIKMLNGIKEKILVVRGNCDAEVDQMVLEFPIMADYAYLMIDDRRIYAAHGHKYSDENKPCLLTGEVYIQGHTHIYKAEKVQGNFYLNPGSVALAKNGNPNTYAVLEKDTFSIKDMEGNLVKEFLMC